MNDMQRQYQDSTKMMARAMLHIKYGPRGKPPSFADAGLIKTGNRVLDIGCGPGRFWAACSMAGLRVQRLSISALLLGISALCCY